MKAGFNMVGGGAEGSAIQQEAERLRAAMTEGNQDLDGDCDADELENKLLQLQARTVATVEAAERVASQEKIFVVQLTDFSEVYSLKQQVEPPLAPPCCLLCKKLTSTSTLHVSRQLLHP